MAITPFIADSVVQNAVAQRQQTTWANLVVNAAQYAGIVTDANQEAALEIVRIMGMKGYSLSLITQWDYVTTYNRKLAMWIAIRDATKTINYTAAQAIDDEINGILEEMQGPKVLITIDGVFFPPDTPASGNVGSGNMNASIDCMNAIQGSIADGCGCNGNGIFNNGQFPYGR